MHTTSGRATADAIAVPIAGSPQFRRHEQHIKRLAARLGVTCAPSPWTAAWRGRTDLVTRSCEGPALLLNDGHVAIWLHELAHAATSPCGECSPRWGRILCLSCELEAWRWARAHVLDGRWTEDMQAMMIASLNSNRCEKAASGGHSDHLEAIDRFYLRIGRAAWNAAIARAGVLCGDDFKPDGVSA